MDFGFPNFVSTISDRIFQLFSRHVEYQKGLGGRGGYRSVQVTSQGSKNNPCGGEIRDGIFYIEAHQRKCGCRRGDSTKYTSKGGKRQH
jgi:hypothetical protein